MNILFLKSNYSARESIQKLNLYGLISAPVSWHPFHLGDQWRAAVHIHKGHCLPLS